jgi:hypothetical protein
MRRACDETRWVQRVMREGGSNSVVESQPSKLLVAGSIPVSRSNLRSPRELRLASLEAPVISVGKPRGTVILLTAELASVAQPRADLSAVAEGEGRCSSVGRARPW